MLVKWTIPNSHMEQSPYGMSGTINLKCDKCTRRGESVRSKTKKFTRSVHKSIKPTISSVTVSEAV